MMFSLKSVVYKSCAKFKCRSIKSPLNSSETHDKKTPKKKRETPHSEETR